MLAGLAWVVVGLMALASMRPGPLVGAFLVVALTGTLLGLVGLHARQATSYGELGGAGFVLALAGGSVMLVGLVLVFLGLGIGSFAQFFGLLMLVMGLVLLGVATLRTGTLPRWCGMALIVAATALLVLVGYGGNIVFGAVWLGLGYVLWSGRGEAAQQPFPRNDR